MQRPVYLSSLRLRNRFALTNIFCLVALFASGLPAQSLHLESQSFDATTLTHFTNERFTFSTATQDGRGPIERTVESGALVRWGAWTGVGRRPAVWLSDGSWLAGRHRIEGNQVFVRSDWLECPPLSLDSLRGLVPNPPKSLRKWGELQREMLNVSGEEDTVWLTSGAKLQGIVEVRSLTAAPEDGAVVQVGAKQVVVDWSEVRAIVFSPALLGPVPQFPDAFTIGLSDGSLLACRAAQARTASELSGEIKFELMHGVVLSAFDEPADFAKAIKFLAGTPPATKRLSGFEVAQYKHLSDNELVWKLGSGKDCYGRPLFVDQPWQGIIPDGLAMHSTSQVAFRSDGKASRLLAELRIATPRLAGSVRHADLRCRVLVARDGKLSEVANLALDRDRSSQLLDCDVAGAQLVVLRVESADRGQLGDHVLWLDVRLFEP